MKQKIAIIGALTMMGRALLDGLSDNGYPISKVCILDSRQNMGIKVPFEYNFLLVEDMEVFDFHQVSLVFLCTSALLSVYREKILESGAYLVDCTGILENGICLIPSLNLKEADNNRIFCNPTSLTIPLAHVLTSIHARYQIRYADATVLLSAGIFGSSAIQMLMDQTRCLYTREEPSKELFPKVQAFNLIPEICPTLIRLTANQLKSFIKAPITLSSCLTPVFQGECYSLTFTTRKACSLKQLKNLFVKQKCYQYIEPLSPELTLSTQDAVIGHSIYITHLSSIPDRGNTFRMWILCDSVRRGSVQNAIRIAEYLLS